MKYYEYRQNNSGGSFDINEAVGQYVFIQAENDAAANFIAENIGIYFDGCEDDIDCECCGDRWYPPTDEHDVPQLYHVRLERDYTLDKYPHTDIWTRNRELVVHVYHADGTHDKHVWEPEPRKDE